MKEKGGKGHSNEGEITWHKYIRAEGYDVFREIHIFECNCGKLHSVTLWKGDIKEGKDEDISSSLWSN